MSRAKEMYFAMAFFFGFSQAVVDDMDLDYALSLMNGLKQNPQLAGMKAIGKMLGM